MIRAFAPGLALAALLAAGLGGCMVEDESDSFEELRDGQPPVDPFEFFNRNHATLVFDQYIGPRNIAVATVPGVAQHVLRFEIEPSPAQLEAFNQTGSFTLGVQPNSMFDIIGRGTEPNQYLALGPNTMVDHLVDPQNLNLCNDRKLITKAHSDVGVIEAMGISWYHPVPNPIWGHLPCTLQVGDTCAPSDCSFPWPAPIDSPPDDYPLEINGQCRGAWLANVQFCSCEGNNW